MSACFRRIQQGRMCPADVKSVCLAVSGGGLACSQSSSLMVTTRQATHHRGIKDPIKPLKFKTSKYQKQSPLNFEMDVVLFSMFLSL